MEKEIKHIEQKLQNLVGKETGFALPKSYLSDFEDTLEMNVIESSFSKTEGYSIPENYFDSLENTILSKVKKEPKIISFKSNVYRFITVAAAIIIVIFIGVNFVDSNSIELTDDEIANWFESDIESITNYDLALALEDVYLQDSEITISSITTNSIEEYLNNEDITNLLEDY